MRVPTRSEGTRSGVNCTRANVPPRTPAVVLIVSVFARPGTPSISRCPCASRQTSTRSSIASWPAITRLISNSVCSSRSFASSGDGGGASFACFTTWSLLLRAVKTYTEAGPAEFSLRGSRHYELGVGRGRRRAELLRALLVSRPVAGEKQPRIVVLREGEPRTSAHPLVHLQSVLEVRSEEH